MAKIKLKQYFEALREADNLRFKELREADAAAIAAALAAAEKAVSKAEVANERRFENTNEWCSTYGDLANQGRGAVQLVSIVIAAAAAIAAVIAVVLTIANS